jgi:acyl dehydratase
MTTTTADFNADALGQWGDPLEFPVTQEAIVKYAQATNDDIPQHLAGEIAPPVFAIVSAFGAVAPAVLPVVPPEYLMMVVHGEQDFHFHKPILPGTTLSTTAAAVGIQPRSSGVTVIAKAVTHDQAGDLVVEQYMTSFFRGAQTEVSAGEAAPGHGFDEALRAGDPIATVDQTFDADQTYRYSEASGDLMPIHLDDAMAKSVGLPGIIIHGLCTMAFTSSAVIKSTCPDDPTRLKRLAVRFAKTCFPEETITTSIYDKGDGVFAYETTNNDGAPVIKDGLAEVRS